MTGSEPLRYDGAGRESMADLFLSYAAEDRERARALADLLANRGWSVWWDREIRPGTTFDRAIERELEQARGVVVMWSRSSVESDWVRAEAREGLSRRVLVPVLVEDDVRIPLEFRSIQAARLPDLASPDRAEARTLFSALEGILGAAGPAASPIVARDPSPPRRRWPVLLVVGAIATGAAALALWRAATGARGSDPVATSASSAAEASGPAAASGNATDRGIQPIASGGSARPLALGSSGQDVADLRATLRLLGYLEGRGTVAEEMSFGVDTRDAVARFQKDRNLVPDGIAGPQLQDELRNLARRGPRVPGR